MTGLSFLRNRECYQTLMCTNTKGIEILMKKTRIATNALLNTVKSVVGIVFPLITFPYVTRVLGTDKLGIYTFSSSIISYFLLISMLGIPTYGIREGTQYRDDQDLITKFVSEIFTINIMSTIISYLLLCICLILVPKFHNYTIIILILSIEMIMTMIGVAWVCNIYEDFLFVTIRTLAIQFISLVLTLIFVKKPEDLYIYVGIVVLANSGANLLNFFYIRRKYCKFKITKNADWKRHLKPIMVIFSTSVAITVYVSSDITMLGFMTSDYYVGLYGTAVKIYNIIKQVLSALLMVLIPQFSLMFARGEKQRSNQLFSKVFNILTVLMLPMIVGLFMLSDDVIKLIAGDDYLGGAGAFRLLIVAVLFSLYAYMYTQCILIPAKREDIVFKATTLSAVINIGLNFVLIPLWGINAAAITTIVAEAITFVTVAITGKKYVSLNGISRTLISSVIGCCGIIVVCLFSYTLTNYILRIVISVGCSVIVYGVIVAFTNKEIFAQLKGMLKEG